MGLWLGILIILIEALLGFLISLFLFFAILPILRGAPFVPTKKERIERAIELVQIRGEEKIVDLGCGDGRILIAAARAGVKAQGFEINPFLVWKARRNIKKQELQDLVVCQWKNFWWQDLSVFDVVFVYGIGHIMKGLEKKLQRELKPGARVVSFIFRFPNWHPSWQENGIYIYQRIK